mmetsp:Transcript_3009/g.5282  ORF Transcript_3009/g.5282 Transcript_3009/m.5282 type:complete len:208 (-) Transcript_3009:816-1439(-)
MSSSRMWSSWWPTPASWGWTWPSTGPSGMPSRSAVRRRQCRGRGPGPGASWGPPGPSDGAVHSRPLASFSPPWLCRWHIRCTLPRLPTPPHPPPLPTASKQTSRPLTAPNSQQTKPATPLTAPNCQQAKPATPLTGPNFRQAKRSVPSTAANCQLPVVLSFSGRVFDPPSRVSLALATSTTASIGLGPPLAAARHAINGPKSRPLYS